MRNDIARETVERKIYLIRGERVMLDKDLAELYGVPTCNLNKSVKRHRYRFPADFMFQLTAAEFTSLRFQFGMSKEGRGGRRYRPYVFTEHGVAMLSSVLHSVRAVQVNIAIIRVFVRLKQMISLHKELGLKLELLEKKIEKHDGEIQSIFAAIRQLMRVPEEPKRRIGFHQNAHIREG